MRKAIQVILVFLCGVCFAQDTPYYLRDTKSNQDLGALNQNLRDLSMRPGSKLTKTVTPTSCPAGQTLTGAVFQNGQTWGGTCQAFVTNTSSQTFSGTTTFYGLLVSSTAWTNGNQIITIANHSTIQGIAATQVSSNPVSVTAFVITGLDANALYELNISTLTQLGATTNSYRLYFSSDAIGGTCEGSANYWWVTTENGSTGSANADTNCSLEFNTTGSITEQPGDGSQYFIRFETSGTETRATWYGSTYDRFNTRDEDLIGSCRFKLGPIRSICIKPTAGQMQLTGQLIRIN